MADSSRIRNALDKSIYLGSIRSGKMAIDPKGAYIIRLSNNNYFIEAEIIYGKILSIKYFGTAGAPSTIYISLTSNNFIVYSTESTNALLTSSLALNTYVEYNLNPITVYGNGDSPNIGSLQTSKSDFSLNRTYYLEKVELSNTNDINAANIHVDTLDVNKFKTELTELKVTNNAEIKVPKLVVQTVGVEQMDVNRVTAKDIATKEIILSNGNNRGWKFIADSNVSGSTNTITLKANIDN